MAILIFKCILILFFLIIGQNIDEEIKNSVSIFNTMNNINSNNLEPNYINEFEKFDNFSQSLNDFEKNGKYNSSMVDEFFPKCNSTFESHQKNVFDNNEFNIQKTNDFFKDIFISKDNNNFIFKENDEEFMITNKGFDFYNYKYFN